MREELMYGLHAVLHLLKVHPKKVKELYLVGEVQDVKFQEIVTVSHDFAIPLHALQKKQMDTLVPNAVHQGVAARFIVQAPMDEYDLMDLLQNISGPPFLLILDSVQDPHNLGAAIRVADAAGVHAIIVPKDKSVGLTAVVRKVASGAAETLPFVQVTNLVRTIEMLKKEGIWVMGLAGEATKNVYEHDLTGPLAIILGAEGSGLRRLTREHCDHLLFIPMLGYVESLNVSTATAVCLYEAIRQRKSFVKGMQ